MEALRIALVQFTEPMSTFVNLPYCLGLLQSYVEAHARDPKRYHFLPPVFLRQSFATLLPQLVSADLVGLSCYVWNSQFSLALARQLKRLKPELCIVLGGPHVPDHAEDFLRAHPYVDLCVHGEGEESFLELLEALPERNWDAVQSVSWLQNDEYHNRPKRPRNRDLDSIPSPYLNGYFDPVLAAHPELKWAAPWESNRGCPFSCTFCDWGSAVASKVYRFERKRLKQEIRWFAEKRIDVIYCCDSNFGMLPRDIELAQELAEVKSLTGFPRVAYTQMTKNKSDRAFEAQKILYDAKMNPSSTLSLQSLSPDTLKAIKRDNISSEVYRELLRRFVAADMPAYTDYLVGLPGETWESFVDGICQLLEQGQHQEIRFWNVYVLPNAEMAQPTYRAQHQLETLSMHYVSPLTPVKPPLEGIYETQEMLVSSSTMPRNDWARMRALAWMTHTLHHGKLLQPALLLLEALTELSHRDLLLYFFSDPLPFQAPAFEHLRQFFRQRAQEILQGQPEYVAAPDHKTGELIWYPTAAYALTELLYSPHLPQVYAEAEQLLQHLLEQRQQKLPNGLLREALLMSFALFRTHDERYREFELQQQHNLWHNLQRIRRLQPVELQRGHWQLRRHQDFTGKWQIQEQQSA